MTRDLTVLGGLGFVGYNFWRRHCYPVLSCDRNERDDYQVRCSNALNFISTVDNYNVWDKPFLDIDTNLTVMMKTLKSWHDNKGRDGTYNFISSWFVYGDELDGNNERLSVKENDVCNPTGFYSITKRAAEQLLISYCTTHKLNWRILRLGSVVGEGDQKMSKKKNAIQWMVNEIAQGRDVDVYQSAHGSFRHFIHVDDAADIIAGVLEKGERNSIYNVGTTPMTVGFVLDQAKELTHSKARINLVNTPEFHQQVQTTSFTMDTSKIRALGLRPYRQENQIVNSMISKT